MIFVIYSQVLFVILHNIYLNCLMDFMNYCIYNFYLKFNLYLL